MIWRLLNRHKLHRKRGDPIIRDFDVHATRVVNSLVQAGLLAAGQSGTNARAILNPSKILDDGFQATDILAKNVQNAGPFDLGVFLSSGLSYLLIIGAFAALALNAFIALLEYYLAIAVAGIFLPFAVLQPTRWVAMKPISFLLASAMKMMIISFLLAIIAPILQSIRFPNQTPDMRDIWVMVCTTGTLAAVCWVVPQRFAQGFMSGSAPLGASDTTSLLAGAAVAGVAALGAAARGTAAMGRSALNAWNTVEPAPPKPPSVGDSRASSSTASPGMLASTTTPAALSPGSRPPELSMGQEPPNPPPQLPPGGATADPFASTSQNNVPLAVFETRS
jgi:type IV secretion system protein TrbL